MHRRIPSMSNPQAECPAQKPFKMRRRAYVACIACRKRKVRVSPRVHCFRVPLPECDIRQCVAPSVDDDKPCVRCKARGRKCEFRAVPDTEESTSSGASAPPGTPPLLLLGESFPWEVKPPARTPPDPVTLNCIPPTCQAPSFVKGSDFDAVPLNNPDRGVLASSRMPPLSPVHDTFRNSHFSAFDRQYSPAHPPSTAIYAPTPRRFVQQLDLSFAAYPSPQYSGHNSDYIFPSDSYDGYAHRSFLYVWCSQPTERLG
jgi:hypothetical protein